MKKLLKVLLGLFVVLVVFAVFSRNESEGGAALAAETEMVSDASGPTEETEAVPEPEESMAVIIAQGKIKERLKSPSTADFEMFNGQAINKGDGRYLVKDHVDSQNGFGATIRSEYIVDMHYNGGDAADEANWTVNEVQMD